MTHDQHNEAPNLLHISDIFLCHSTCNPSNLRFSSLPTFLNEFCEHSFSLSSLLSVSRSVFLLYTIVLLLLRLSAIIPSSSNISFCTIHSFIMHSSLDFFLFFFTLKHATPLPLPKPLFIPPFKSLSFSLLPLSP